MATTTRSGAVYGIGTYGTAVYGVSNVSIVPDGTQSLANTDPDVVITADANHVITSVQGVVSNGGVGQVVADAVVPVSTGVEATGSTGTVSVSHNARPTFIGVEGTGTTGTTTVVAKAVVIPAGVSGTNSAGTPTVSADANTATVGVEGTVSLGVVTQKTVNRVPVSGIEGTGAVGTTTVVAKAAVVPTGVSATIITDQPLITTDDVVVDADANVAVTGVSATGAVGTGLTFITDQFIVPLNVYGNGRVKAPTVSTVRNVFDANNSNPLRIVSVLPGEERIVYISEDEPRTVQVDAGVPRIVYVKAA